MLEESQLKLWSADPGDSFQKFEMKKKGEKKIPLEKSSLYPPL